MKQRKLGKNGPTISAIGVGAMSLTSFYGDMDEERGHAVLDAAIEEGVTHIDTSNVYGPHISENVIGSFLAKPASRTRVIATMTTAQSILRKSWMDHSSGLAWSVSICSMCTVGRLKSRSKR